jgi:hypothetical protein
LSVAKASDVDMMKKIIQVTIAFSIRVLLLILCLLEAVTVKESHQWRDHGGRGSKAAKSRGGHD